MFSYFSIICLNDSLSLTYSHTQNLEMLSHLKIEGKTNCGKIKFLAEYSPMTEAANVLNFYHSERQTR